MKKFRVGLAAALVGLGVSGVVVGSSTTHDICGVHDATVQCHLPPAPQSLSLSGTSAAQGIDFAWSCPVSQAKNFGDSYVSYDTSKDWSRSCVDAFHKAHKATAAVWEAGANDAQGSSSLGRSQTLNAISQLNALGAGPHQPVVLAIDCDCQGSSLVNYFQGANDAVKGTGHTIDAYGGYNQILYLYQHHLVGHANWQTYAWSGGKWLSASIAPLEQYHNSSSVDYDRAIAPYYGQWPYNPPTPPQPSGPKCFGSTWQHTSFCSKIRAQDAALGKEITKEQGYLKVSTTNETKLNKRLHTVGVNITKEQAQLQKDFQQGDPFRKVTAELRVSLGNQAHISYQLALVNGHIAVEQAKIKSENATLQASLKKYGLK